MKIMIKLIKNQKNLLININKHPLFIKKQEIY
jgi:hypothetical protein